MYSPTFQLAAFNADRDPHLSAEILHNLLWCLVGINEAWFRAKPDLPDLYDADVRYYADRFWEGPWYDARLLVAVKFADCKSLACYRAAYLRVRRGIAAEPIFTRQLLPDGSLLYHVLVRLPNGAIEDPSRILGMPG